MFQNSKRGWQRNLTVDAMLTSMSIVLLVSLFLLNSDRIEKAIKIYREPLILLDNNDQKQQRPIHLITATILQRHAYSSFQRLSSYLWLCKCRKVRHETASHYIIEGWGSRKCTRAITCVTWIPHECAPGNSGRWQWSAHIRVPPVLG